VGNSAHSSDTWPSKKLEVLACLPEDRKAAEVYSAGTLLVEALPEFRDHFADIMIGLGLLQDAWKLKDRRLQT
jgi:hypothetical protein